MALNPGVFGDAPSAPVSDSKKAARAPREHSIRLNGVEIRMRDWLEARLRRGEISGWKPHAMKLRYALHDAADGTTKYCTYSPDFVVEELSGKLTMIETKGGYARTKDTTRYKAARSDWPCFNFELWQWAEGQWHKAL